MVHINGDYPLVNDMIPSGKRLHNYGKIHHAINGKIHYFDWAIFNSKLLVYHEGSVFSSNSEFWGFTLW